MAGTPGVQQLAAGAAAKLQPAAPAPIVKAPASAALAAAERSPVTGGAALLKSTAKAVTETSKAPSTGVAVLTQARRPVVGGGGPVPAAVATTSEGAATAAPKRFAGDPSPAATDAPATSDAAGANTLPPPADDPYWTNATSWSSPAGVIYAAEVMDDGSVHLEAPPIVDQAYDAEHTSMYGRDVIDNTVAGGDDGAGYLEGTDAAGFVANIPYVIDGGVIYAVGWDAASGQPTYTEAPAEYVTVAEITIQTDGTQEHVTTTTGQLTNGGTDEVSWTVDFDATGTVSGSVERARRAEHDATGQVMRRRDVALAFGSDGAMQTSIVSATVRSEDGVVHTNEDFVKYGPGAIPIDRITTMNVAEDRGSGGMHPVFRSTTDYDFDASGQPTHIQLEQDTWGSFWEDLTYGATGLPSHGQNDPDAGGSASYHQRLTRTVDGGGQPLVLGPDGEPVDAPVDELQSTTIIDHAGDGPEGVDYSGDHADQMLVQTGTMRGGEPAWTSFEVYDAELAPFDGSAPRVVGLGDRQVFEERDIDPATGMPKGSDLVFLGLLAASVLLIPVSGGASLALGAAASARSLWTNTGPDVLADPSASTFLMAGLDVLGVSGIALRGARLAAGSGTTLGRAANTLAGVEGAATISTSGNVFVDLLGMGAVIAGRHAGVQLTTVLGVGAASVDAQGETSDSADPEPEVVSRDADPSLTTAPEDE